MSQELQNIRPMGRVVMTKRPANQRPANIETWKEHAGNRNKLAARVALAEKRGQVRRLGNIELNRQHAAAVVVIRLKPEPKRWPARLAVAVVMLALVAGISYALYSIADLIVLAFGVLCAVALLFWLLTRISHSGGCTGLHCSGCKG
jgi:hypothetical protein